VSFSSARAIVRPGGAPPGFFLCSDFPCAGDSARGGAPTASPRAPARRLRRPQLRRGRRPARATWSDSLPRGTLLPADGAARRPTRPSRMGTKRSRTTAAWTGTERSAPVSLDPRSGPGRDDPTNGLDRASAARPSTPRRSRRRQGLAQTHWRSLRRTAGEHLR
jgi:hypothetical protein